MKINSNTISLDKAELASIETIIKKIATENNISDVEEVRISLNQEKGLVSFKTAISEENPLHQKEYFNPSKGDITPMPKDISLIVKRAPFREKIQILSELGFSDTEIEQYIARSYGVLPKELEGEEVDMPEPSSFEGRESSVVRIEKTYVRMAKLFPTLINK